MGTFADWRSTPLPDGVLHVPPEGLRLSAIRVTEQVRPVEPLTTLIHDVVAQLAPVTDELVVAPHEQLVTYEGEHAALVRISGRRSRNGGTIEYLFGFIFTDDYYVGVVAYCTDEAQLKGFRISLRAFLLEYELRLGGRRARRFLYTPPPGWQGRARGLRAEWFPLAFPRHGSRIFVTPAVPCEQTFSELEAELRELLASPGFVVTHQLPKVRLSTEHGLSGWLWQCGSDAREIVAATMLDDRYGYHLRLDTVPEHLAADRALFLRVVQSVRPVPAMTVGQSDALLRAMTPA